MQISEPFFLQVTNTFQGEKIMKLNISRADVWASGIKDRPGGLAEKLELLAQAGVNLKFVIARRIQGKSKKGVVFVTPINGAKQTKAAGKAGFTKTKSLQGLRIVAADRAGLGAKITRRLAEAGINLRGFSGASINKRAVFYLAFDQTADVNKAMRILKAM
jgi:hypothetical protein